MATRQADKTIAVRPEPEEAAQDQRAPKAWMAANWAVRRLAPDPEALPPASRPALAL